MSKILSLILKPKSPWITPLQADTIFGHLCWKIKQNEGKNGKEGKKKLEDFLGEMEKEPFFVISNVFPAGYIPRPRLEIEFLKEGEAKKITPNETKKGVMSDEFDKIKDYNKEVNLIKIEDLKQYFAFSDKNENHKEKIDKIMEEETKKLKDQSEKEKQSFVSDREIKTAINRFTSTTMEGQSPYSLPYFSFEGDLWLLMKVLDEKKVEEYNIKEYLKLVFTEGYGKRKSIGKGVFEIEKDWEEEQITQNENGKNLLLLSNFVPSENDPTDGLYEIFVKYGKLGEEKSIAGSGNFYKKPLIMLKEGATFKISSPNKEYLYLGRMLKGISSDDKVYHYAYGFPLRF